MMNAIRILLAAALALGTSQANARYLQADPLGLVDGASVYGYVGQNPMNGIDPTGLYCRTTDGRTTCSIPGKYRISWPQQPGWNSGYNFGPGDELYHFYNESTLTNSCFDQSRILNGLISAPEPLPSNGASRQGTWNYANPVGPLSGMLDAMRVNPVTSFIVTDEISGRIGTVNVTRSWHTLSDGYVVRFPTQSGILVFGEGNGPLQSNRPIVGGARNQINSVWGPANDAILYDR